MFLNKNIFWTNEAHILKGFVHTEEKKKKMMIKGSALHQRVKTKTAYLKITHCLFLLLFASLYTYLNCGHVIFQNSRPAYLSVFVFDRISTEISWQYRCTDGFLKIRTNSFQKVRKSPYEQMRVCCQQT